MPPSGFTNHNTKGIGDFFRSCVIDLTEENKETISPKVAVASEIKSIDRDSIAFETKRSEASTSVLQLIKSFYQKLYADLNDNDDYGILQKKSEEVVTEFCAEFESIKIKK